MRNFFSLDSKLVVALSTLCDYIFLNVIFLICCIPIITIGPAKTALYRVMFNMNSDEGAIYTQFFRTFRADFGTAALFGVLHLLGFVLLGYEIQLVWMNRIFAWIPVLVLLSIVLLLWEFTFSNLFAQLARYKTTSRLQLFRNSLIIGLSHPLRSILIVVMELLPLLVFFLAFYYFVVTAVLWAFLYFSISFNLSARLLRKTFAQYDPADQNHRSE